MEHEPHVDMSELIARSTLGTPEALALRAQTPRLVRIEILAGLTVLERPVLFIVRRSRWTT